MCSVRSRSDTALGVVCVADRDLCIDAAFFLSLSLSLPLALAFPDRRVVQDPGQRCLQRQALPVGDRLVHQGYRGGDGGGHGRGVLLQPVRKEGT